MVFFALGIDDPPVDEMLLQHFDDSRRQFRDSRTEVQLQLVVNGDLI